MSFSGRAFGFLRERGVAWTALWATRSALVRLGNRLEEMLVRIEKRRFLTGESTICGQTYTASWNKNAWNAYDWSRRGEEWTEAARELRHAEPQVWKQTLVDRMILRYLPRESVVLEIGPGGGRWTEVLVPQCRRLVLGDVAETCLAVCRERFAKCENIEYRLIENGTLEFLGDETIDFVWSYDVFVHINPTETERYLAEIGRVLKEGGTAVLHHSGEYASESERRRAFRAHMSREFFAHLVNRSGMEVVEQDDSLPHFPGDWITVARRDRSLTRNQARATRRAPPRSSVGLPWGAG